MIKRAFDIALASVGLIGTSPLWALFAVLIKTEDGGPIFFSQERVGLNGRVFMAFKFRSMIPDAERHTGPIQATVGDSRVTRIGALLRATAMDELPQLLNILRGDMSFVGPRPLRPGEQDSTADGVVQLTTIPGYEERHTVRPGLTGLAQVYAARDVARAEKFKYDIQYLQRAGLWLDLQLIIRSVWITVRGRWEAHDPRI
ncbi:MAG TPA: sugar transferase [Vicinamibacterales bacterium]|nr:sugar transferase [Vicinamibacterales bacterium]